MNTIAVLIALPLAMALGMLLGAWLQYRARHDMSPLPRLEGIIGVARRPKPQPVNNHRFPTLKG